MAIDYSNSSDPNTSPCLRADLASQPTVERSSPKNSATDTRKQTTAAVQQLSDMLQGAEIDWPSCASDSGSESIDTSRIIKSSDILRSRLSHYYRGHRRSRSQNYAESQCSDLSSEIDAAVTPAPATEDVPEESQSTEDDASILKWNPQFLNNVLTEDSASKPAPQASNVLPSDMSADGDQTHPDQRYYPLRHRSEKNLHPYTKLEWTNPADLMDSRNRRRDISLFYDTTQDVNSASQSATGDIGFAEDSEDEEYLPELGDLVETQAEMAADDWGSPTEQRPMPAPLVSRRLAAPSLSTRGHRGGLTYKHMAVRRRHANRLDALNDDESTAFPSVEALLGNRSLSFRDTTDADADPFGVPQSLVTPQQMTATDDHAVKLYSELSSTSESGVEQSVLAHSPAQDNHVVGEDDEVESNSTPGRTRRRRRLISRRQQEAAGHVSDDEDALPTAKARKLNKISRHHIRGVLPFSFMRGLNQEKRTEIQEEVSRWHDRNDRRSAKRRVLSSSPRPELVETDSDDVYAGMANPPAADDQTEDRHSGYTRQPLFEFNFLDIYRWAYPKTSLIEQTGRAPDFLRVAARECRRRADGLGADDPWRKHISVAARKQGELEDEDVAQSILGAWRLRVIDVRRVYFCDDEVDDETGSYAGDEGENLGTQPPDYNTDEEEAIVISDDEAIEDNRMLGLGGRHARASRGTRKSRGSKRPRLRHSGERQALEAMPHRGSRRHSSSMLLMGRQDQSVDQRSTTVHTNVGGGGIRDVMGEFAAFDSDSDSSGGNNENDRRSRPQPLQLPPGAIGKHLAWKRREDVRRHDFVNRFTRLRAPASSSRHSRPSATSSRFNHAGISKHRSAAGERAEFLFDDYDVYGKASSSRMQHQGRHQNQQRQRQQQPSQIHSHRPRQTKLFTSTGQIQGARILDAVADRISKKPQSRTKPLAPWKATRSSGFNRPTARKAALPTRVQMHFHVQEHNPAALNTANPGTEDESDAGDARLRIGLPSGTRFSTDTWVGQGGISRMRRLLMRGADGNSSSTYVTEFQHDDVLRVGPDATIGEFIQAFTMLCLLWRDTAPGDSALQWIEFAQHFITRHASSARQLANVAHQTVQCVHAQLASAQAPAALALGISLMQIAREVGSWRQRQMQAVGAVGGQDDVDLDAWPDERLAREIDNCVLVVAGQFAAKGDVWLLDANAQLLVVLMHAFDTVASMFSLAPLQDAVLRGCSQGTGAGLYWRALARMTSLAQINEDGIAAPRTDARWHAALVAIAETAIAQCLRPELNDVGVRQTFERVRQLVCALGIRVAPNSRLHVLLFRFLEARQFASLAIEPAPALPRFFTRYAGAIPSGESNGGPDTCTVLWLRALDVGFSDWTVQLQRQTEAASAKILRGVRALVSKLLPTRILTVDSSQGLAALANYYAVFLFFLHAVPHAVVRPTRLYAQLQSLLRFRESVSATARRVYFEAWSAAVTILGLRLRTLLEQSQDVRSIEALASCCYIDGGNKDRSTEEQCAALGVDAGVTAYFSALLAAVAGWSEAVAVVSAESRPEAWHLVDAALGYVLRVLQSSALEEHSPTILLLLLAVMCTPVFKSVVAATLSTQSSTAISSETRLQLLARLRAMLDLWQHAVAVRPAAIPEAGTLPQPGSIPMSDSQNDFGFMDSEDMLRLAAEADELERRAVLAPVDNMLVQLIHQTHIPEIRRHIIASYSSLGPSSASRLDSRSLTSLLALLVQMLSICVDAGLRTWESFLHEHGRDSLYLIPDEDARRRVLLVFAVLVIDCLRAQGKHPNASLDSLVRDVWFAAVPDIRLSAYIQRLSAQLLWADSAASDSHSDTPVFAMLPANMRLLKTQGVLKHPAYEWSPAADDLAVDEAAVNAVAFTDAALGGMAALDEQAAETMALRRSVYASWIERLRSSIRQIRESSDRELSGLADTRQLVAVMTDRMSAVVDAHCA
ncbi:hypothetical protein LPJ53_001532 [Coemansia erecta]|uniref:Mus7/MMS22 family-domain-containing protein n=1 Tax=Coemansia erecta TaxID=147472 RepID=A0A9W8CSR6_9FUNG|nr:hypothetical protein LPJ53_001532 [Coemansia erecta]